MEYLFEWKFWCNSYTSLDGVAQDYYSIVVIISRYVSTSEEQTPMTHRFWNFSSYDPYDSYLPMVSLAQSLWKSKSHHMSMHRKHFSFLISFDSPMTLTGEALVLVLGKSLSCVMVTTGEASRFGISPKSIPPPKSFVLGHCETIARP